MKFGTESSMVMHARAAARRLPLNRLAAAVTLAIPLLARAAGADDPAEAPIQQVQISATRLG
jgi:outer membrane receptor for ferric coprogen and ferric-rhodotorulic acid